MTLRVQAKNVLHLNLFLHADNGRRKRKGVGLNAVLLSGSIVQIQLLH